MAGTSPSGGRDARRSDKETDNRNRQTPNTDLQPEDAGTPASGNTGRGTAADAAMKQTSKTDAERNSGR